MVDLSLDVLDFPPDRIGPLSVSRLLTEVIPRSLLAPEPLLLDLDRIVREWMMWRLDALDLHKRDRSQVHQAIDTATRVLLSRCRNRSVQPQYPYVADLPRDCAGGPELFAALRRRSFAVPLPGDRGDGLVKLDRPANGLPAGSTHVDSLDAAQTGHRRLITAIEQSRHRDVPQREFPSRTGLVNQLWSDEPGEVWVTAQRLTRSGLPRQRVIEKLARLWERHGPADLAEMESGSMHPGPELDAYLAALSTVR